MLEPINDSIKLKERQEFVFLCYNIFVNGNQNNNHNLKYSRMEGWAELITWSVMILVLLFLRLLPQQIIANDVTYYLIGAIVSFALLYYTVINRYFSRTNRLWIKDISDVVIVSVLIIIAKDYGTYFYSLYFLPIAAAALVLGTIDSLLIATLASIFIVSEIFLNAENILPSKSQLYLGFFQIGFIMLMTLFCRFLALQTRQERKAREEAIAHAEALEVIEKREREFMTLTSHQLYTPLSIIRGFASLLHYDEKKRLTKKQNDYVKEIYQNTKRMIDLVSELLSISRIRSNQTKFKMCDVEIENLISHVIEQLKPNAEHKKITLENIAPSSKLPKICADSMRLEQALYNIVDNAIKFTDHGKVTISTELKDKYLLVKIKDTGRGISHQDKEKLFQPFFRGKNILELEKEGTGLGLYIVKTIIEKHKGRIWVDSKVGEGSTFNITLPY